MNMKTPKISKAKTNAQLAANPALKAGDVVTANFGTETKPMLSTVRIWSLNNDGADPLRVQHLACGCLDKITISQVVC